MPENPSPIDPQCIPVTAAVIVKDGKVLIAKKRVPAASPWEFPGGKLEDKESLEACLKREILEELDITIAVGPLICSNRHVTGHGKAIILYAYLSEYLSGEIDLREHEEVQWVSPEDLVGYAFPVPDRLIADKVRQLFRGQPGIRAI